MDAAIEWAQANKADLKVIFITTKEVPSDQYPFPNDLQMAEEADTAVSTAQVAPSVQLTKDQWRFLQRRAAEKGITITTDFLVNPSMSVVMAQCENADHVFLESNADASELMLEGFRFDLSDLVDRLLSSDIPLN